MNRGGVLDQRRVRSSFLWFPRCNHLARTNRNCKLIANRAVLPSVFPRFPLLSRCIETRTLRRYRSPRIPTNSECLPRQVTLIVANTIAPDASNVLFFPAISRNSNVHFQHMHCSFLAFNYILLLTKESRSTDLLSLSPHPPTRSNQSFSR